MTNGFDLRAARLNQGLTQRDLSVACGVSLTTVQRLEDGKGATPANMKKVADHFEIAVMDLMPTERQAA